MDSNSITMNNIDIVRREIMKKNQPDYAYTPELKTVQHVITDTDQFPYRRFFRGVYYSDSPVVWEREAGYRKRMDDCYKPCFDQTEKPQDVYPYHCFEAAPSTVYPCYPDYLRKYTDKEKMEIMLNRSCLSSLKAR